MIKRKLMLSTGLSTLIFLTVINLGFAKTKGIPPVEEQALDRLNKSPRHGEWVTINAGRGDRVDAWLVYPERSDNAPVVIVIHEIFGLTDWIRAVADQIAAEGYIAIAPDLLSGKGPGGGGSMSVSNDDARGLIRHLEWDYLYAAEQPDLEAAVVYYGVSPEKSRLSDIKAPVLGLYGGDDNRVNSTIPAADEEMKRLGKRYEYELFSGAGHGFLRNQNGREGANMKAAQSAWPRMVEFLNEQLGK
jgi:carboxymethylenebutenolidase